MLKKRRCTIAGITAQGIRRARETILILVFAPMSKKYKKDKEHWGKSASFSPSGWSRCAGPRYVTRRYVWIIISWPLSSVTYQLQAGYNRTRPTRGMFVTFGNIFCFAFGLLVPNECCFVAHIELFIEVGKTEKVPKSSTYWVRYRSCIPEMPNHAGAARGRVWLADLSSGHRPEYQPTTRSLFPSLYKDNEDNDNKDNSNNKNTTTWLEDISSGHCPEYQGSLSLSVPPAYIKGLQLPPTQCGISLHQW